MVSFEPLDIDEANAFLEVSIRRFVAERLPADHVTDAILDRCATNFASGFSPMEADQRSPFRGHRQWR